MLNYKVCCVILMTDDAYANKTHEEKYDMYGLLLRKGFLHLMRGIADGSISGWILRSSISITSNRLYYSEYDTLSTILIKARVALSCPTMSIKDLNILSLLNDFLDICDDILKISATVFPVPDPHIINTKVGLLLDKSKHTIDRHELISTFRNAKYCKLQPGSWQHTRFPTKLGVQDSLSANLTLLTKTILNKSVQ